METVSNGKFGNWSCSELAYWFRFRLTTRHDQTVYSRVASAVWTALSLQLPTTGTGDWNISNVADLRQAWFRSWSRRAAARDIWPPTCCRPRHSDALSSSDTRPMSSPRPFCEIEIKRLPLIKSILQTTQKHNQARTTPTTAYKR